MDIILNTFGNSLSRDNEAFVITSKDGRHRVPVDGIKSIQICRSAQITSDAVMLAIENEIAPMPTISVLCTRPFACSKTA